MVKPSELETPDEGLRGKMRKLELSPPKGEVHSATLSMYKKIY